MLGLTDSLPIAQIRVSDVMAESETRPAEPPNGPERAGGSTARNPEPGDHIGPYRLLETIGQGGMGIVYLAEQEHPVHRRVALKVIKVGMDTAEVIARFESERQALALMNHPNIAAVFDAGRTEAGRPYFVMEHVPGLPITDYCNRHQLTTRERAELFVQVCQGVHHAHQKGIIHRDLKPSNVLVAIRDGKPVPKIIDFGVAKATQQRLTERTLFTQQGVLIGTPEYMSPEQAEMTELGVDSTTDIYSLGVILYEMLVGALPIDPQELRRGGFAAIRYIIREVDPPTPSTRFSTLGEQTTEIARQRRTEPQMLARQVRGELDWITMRALEKDRTRRYQSASEFAADVERHLRDEPVQARPPTAGYRLRKFARRNRSLVAGLSLAFLALAVGLGIATVMYLRAKAANERALWQSYLANIRAAESAIELCNTGEAKVALRAAPPPFRNWEWVYLNALADRSHSIIPRSGFGDYVAYSPDGRYLATARRDSLTIYDASTLEILHTLSFRRAFGTAVAFDPNSKLVAAWGSGKTRDDGAIYVWDVLTGRLLREVPASLSPLDLYWVSPGRLLIANSTNSGISVYDSMYAAHKLPFRFGHCAVTPDARFLAKVDVGVVGVYRLADAHEVASFVLPDGSSPRTVSISDDGRRIAYGTSDGQVGVIDRAANQGPVVLRGHRQDVEATAFSPDGEILASGGRDGTVRIWDVKNPALLTTLLGHEGPVLSLAFSPDGKQLASTANDSTLRMWQMPASNCLDSLMLFDHNDVMKLAADVELTVDRAGRRLAVCSTQDSIVSVLEWPSRTVIFRSSALRREGRCVALGLSEDGRHLAVSFTGRVKPVLSIWDVDSGAAIRDSYSEMTVTAMAYGSSEGDPTIVQGRVARVGDWYPGLVGPDEQDSVQVRVSNPRSGQLISTISDNHSLGRPLALSSDGKYLALLGTNGRLNDWVRVWDTARAVLVREIRVDRVMATALLFIPDSHALIAGYRDGRVLLWNVESGRMIQSCRDGNAEVTALALTADGQRLFIADTGANVFVVDRRSGATLLNLRCRVPASGVIESLAVADGEQQLIAAVRGFGLYMWDAKPLEARRGVGAAALPVR